MAISLVRANTAKDLDLTQKHCGEALSEANFRLDWMGRFSEGPRRHEFVNGLAGEPY
jgi:hypothetical protein